MDRTQREMIKIKLKINQQSSTEMQRRSLKAAVASQHNTNEEKCLNRYA